MTDIWMLYSTFPNRAEALSAARTLVESRLAACANLVDGVTSIYEWQGAVQQEQEVDKKEFLGKYTLFEIFCCKDRDPTRV